MFLNCSTTLVNLSTYTMINIFVEKNPKRNIYRPDNLQDLSHSEFHFGGCKIMVEIKQPSHVKVREVKIKVSFSKPFLWPLVMASSMSSSTSFYFSCTTFSISIVFDSKRGSQGCLLTHSSMLNIANINSVKLHIATFGAQNLEYQNWQLDCQTFHPQKSPPNCKQRQEVY